MACACIATGKREVTGVDESVAEVEIVTRLATEEDLPVLAIFERELARSAFPDDPIVDLSYHRDKLQRALRTEPEGMVVMVATGPGVPGGAELAAWLWLSTKRTLATGERYGVLRSLYVRARWRGRGLAEDLVNYCLRYFAQRDVTRVVAKVHQDNAAAISLLRSGGFRPVHLTLERRLTADDD